MSDLFLKILNMSITGTYVIMAVLLIRILLQKMPSIFSYLLWMPVLFRLLCPVSFKSAYSFLGAITRNTSYIPTNIIYQNTPSINVGISPVNEIINRSLPVATPTASVNPMGIMIWFASQVWILGVLLLLAYGLISYFLLARKVRFATRVSDGIYESNKVESPFVLGLIKPKVYLPMNMNPSDMRYVLAHESIHIKRKDYLVKQLAFLTVALHWFNPLVHVAFRVLNKDIEMSCDEAVMRKMNLAEKKGYSTSLLNLSLHRKNSMMPLAFGESNIKSRIRNILSFRKPATVLVIITMVLLTTACIGLLGDPVSELDSREEWIQELLSNRTPYLGDASKVGGIASQLHYPEGLLYQGVRLETDSVPYSVSVRLKESDGNIEQFLDPNFYVESTLILFSLIENVDEVEYELNTEEKHYTATFTREMFSSQMAQELYRYSESEESFTSFLEDMEDKNFLIPEAGFTVFYDGIEEAFQKIILSSQAPSNPNDYVSAYPDEVTYLVSQGDDTLRYIYTQFELGEQDGFMGQLYKAIAEEILDGEYVDYAEDTPPQYWYDLMKSSMQAVATQHSLGYVQNLYPKASLMLNAFNYYYANDMVMYADSMVEIGGLKLDYERGNVLGLDILTPQDQEQMLFRAVMFCKEGLNHNLEGMKRFTAASFTENDLETKWKLEQNQTFPIGVRGPNMLDDGEFQVFVQINELQTADVRFLLIEGEPRIIDVNVFLR